MKLEDLSTVQIILNEINNNKLIIQNINRDFYIHVDLVTPEINPGGIMVPDDMKNNIAIMFKRRNEFLVNELKRLGVQM